MKPLGCRTCDAKPCTSRRFEDMPPDCPARVEAETVEQSRLEYLGDTFARRLYEKWITLTGRGAARWPRSRHLIDFCEVYGVARVGLACCAGFLSVTNTLGALLEEAGIETVTVCCKVGGLTPKDLELSPNDKWSVCNPVAQARILHQRGTELNVAIGLCMGHDILFAHYSEAPVTTYVVKEPSSRHHTYQTLCLERQKRSQAAGKGPEHPERIERGMWEKDPPPGEAHF